MGGRTVEAPTESASPPAAKAPPAAAGRMRGGTTRGWALGLLLGALALRLLLWARADGFEQGDPVEYVNIAYKIAFGIGIPWWDLRPLLLSLLYVPVLYLGQLWPDPSGEVMVRLLRLVGVLFSVGAVGLVYLVGRRLGGEPVGLVGGLLVAVNPVFNRLSVSTFAEVPSTFFVLLALWCLLERTPRRWLPAGLALGAGCMIRYQAIAFLAPIGLWAVIRGLGAEDSGLSRGHASSVLRPQSPVLAFVAGLGLAALAQAAIEVAAYGRPFHSLLVSFEYNVTSGLAPVEFGAEPFEWYATRIAEWFGWLPLGLAIIGLPAVVSGPRAAEWRLVGLAALTMFLFLSALPHKEVRFMAQVAPLLALFAGGGLARVGSWLRRGASLATSRFDRDSRPGAGPPPGPLPGGEGAYSLSPWERAGGRAPNRARTTRESETSHLAAAPMLSTILALLAAGPLLWASLRLDLGADIAYVDGPKRAAQIKPGGTLGTIPWFVPRPYTGTRLTLERMDRKVWDDREQVTRTIEQSDFLLFPEYWLLEDRYVRHLVDAGFRTIESYENGVVLLQSKRLDEPNRRRAR